MSDELEDTDRSRIRKLIRDAVQQPTIGEVQEVFPHTGTESRPSNHDVTVSVPPGPNATETHERRPVVVPTSGVVSTPEVGDLVLLIFPARSDDPFVVGTVYGDQEEDRAPKADAGVLRLTRGSLYVELLADGTEARIAKKPDDTKEPTAEVTIDDTGAVEVATDGDITVSAGGDVIIDEGGSAKPVLTKDAVFEYEQRVDTGTGSGGTKTKTTTPVSNNEITEVEME